MTVLDAEIRTLAAEFWERSEISPKFPRSLEPAVFSVMPLAVVRLPILSLMTAIDWLQRRGIAHYQESRDRLLHGYLIAQGGVGVIFLDGTDSEDEQRFSLAHEVAHFIFDYFAPRQRAIEVFGSSIADVLDGVRPATAEERLAGVLRGVSLGIYCHLAKRSTAGAVVEDLIFEIEDRADQLALELLAPLSSALPAAKRLGAVAGPPSVAAISDLLMSRYGLPDRAAQAYGRLISSTLSVGRTFRDWLGVP